MYYCDSHASCAALSITNRSACLDVEAQQLCRLQPGTALPLPQFAAQHATRLEQAQEHLAGVYAQAVATAAAACDRALAALQAEMLGVAGAAAGAELAKPR